MSQRRANKGTVHSHFGHARGEVVTILVLVMRNPRCEELLGARKGTGSQHLGAQWVVLELLKVGLSTRISDTPRHNKGPIVNNSQQDSHLVLRLW
jgi:hypothetical protein